MNAVAAAIPADVETGGVSKREVVLVAECERSPAIAETDIGLASEHSPALIQPAIAKTEAIFQLEHGLISAAQILGAHEADPVPVRDTVVKQVGVRATGIADVSHSSVNDAVQRD